MKNLTQYFIRSLIDWFFRPRHPALVLVRISVIILLSLGAGWAFLVFVSTEYGQITFRFDSEGGTSPFILGESALLAFCIFAFGVIWYIVEQKRLSRKKVIVVEVRGLRDTSGTALHEAVPKKLQGRVEQMLIDLRQDIVDGDIVNPKASLDRLTSLPINLKYRENGFDRSDIAYVYGGLAPVPLTFLTGVLMDDENSVTVMDWDRHSGIWRTLNEDDDGKRFSSTGLDIVGTGATEVALVVSVSYNVDMSGVRQKVGNMPIVILTLDSGSPDCHWSEDKQKALGRQFLNSIITLGNRGIKYLHLFLAAQNSVVFRFGRLYDKRNLPVVIVYQYQPKESPTFSWGIRMPVAGNEKPEIIP